MKEIKKFGGTTCTKDEKDCTILQVVDERGRFTNIPLLDKFKRVYVIENHQPNVVRAFHFHEREEILLYCLKGAFKVVTYEGIAGLPPIEAKPSEMVIQAGQFIEVPANHGNGHMNLQEGSIMLCFATLPLSEVVTEEVKQPADKFGDVWTIKRR